MRKDRHNRLQDNRGGFFAVNHRGDFKARSADVVPHFMSSKVIEHCAESEQLFRNFLYKTVGWLSAFPAHSITTSQNAFILFFKNGAKIRPPIGNINILIFQGFDLTNVKCP
jgi:hypothetical protein